MAAKIAKRKPKAADTIAAFVAKGQRAQAAVNATLAEAAIAVAGRVLGRPSAIRGKSASVTFRLTPALRGRLEARALADGVSLSDAIAIVLAAGLDASPAAVRLGPQAAAKASALAGAAAVTDAQIEALRDAGKAAGDRAQVRTCDRALRGIAKDRANCAAMIANDRAAAKAKL